MGDPLTLLVFADQRSTCAAAVRLEDALAAVLRRAFPCGGLQLVLGRAGFRPSALGRVGALRAAVHTSGVALVPGTAPGPRRGCGPGA